MFVEKILSKKCGYRNKKSEGDFMPPPMWIMVKQKNKGYNFHNMLYVFYFLDQDQQILGNYNHLYFWFCHKQGKQLFGSFRSIISNKTVGQYIIY